MRSTLRHLSRAFSFQDRDDVHEQVHHTYYKLAAFLRCKQQQQQQQQTGSATHTRGKLAFVHPLRPRYLNYESIIVKLCCFE
jgi:hypothetical protein